MAAPVAYNLSDVEIAALAALEGKPMEAADFAAYAWRLNHEAVLWHGDPNEDVAAKRFAEKILLRLANMGLVELPSQKWQVTHNGRQLVRRLDPVPNSLLTGG